jgi:hypothetical protein
MTGEVVDTAAVRGALAAAGRLEVSQARLAARSALRPTALARLKGVGDDAATLYARMGQRGVMQTLGVVENADDMRRAARLAAAKGSQSRAILKLLGRSALVVGAILGPLLSATLTILAWCLCLALLARRLGLWLGRLIFGPAKRNPAGGTGGRSERKGGTWKQRLPEGSRAGCAPAHVLIASGA